MGETWNKITKQYHNLFISDKQDSSVYVSDSCIRSHILTRPKRRTASICWTCMQVDRIGGPMEGKKILPINYTCYQKGFQTLSVVSACYTVWAVAMILERVDTTRCNLLLFFAFYGRSIKELTNCWETENNFSFQRRMRPCWAFFTT